MRGSMRKAPASIAIAGPLATPGYGAGGTALPAAAKVLPFRNMERAF
jgi:hypothetical protein